MDVRNAGYRTMQCNCLRASSRSRVHLRIRRNDVRKERLINLMDSPSKVDDWDCPAKTFTLFPNGTQPHKLVGVNESVNVTMIELVV